MRHSVWSLGVPLSVDGPRAAQSSSDYDYETKPNPSDCPASEDRPIIGLFVMAAWTANVPGSTDPSRRGDPVWPGATVDARSSLQSNTRADDSTIADLDSWRQYPWTH
jgi:hypothetical protein